MHIPATVCNGYAMTNAQPSGSKLDWTRGDRLGKALRQSDVPHGEMAELLGVSRNTIGNYIADRTPIRDAFIRVWAMRTGVSFDELKHGTVPAPKGPNPHTSDYGAVVSRLRPRKVA